MIFWRRCEFLSRIRCVGYYHEFEIAEKVVIANELNINEGGYYSHAVIEGVEPGLYPQSSHIRGNRYFYKWDGKNYVKIDAFPDPQCDIISYAPIG